jgi:signal-transduction protein with cAMP-binding, CBS, and nucleotidyltransferase domain
MSIREQLETHPFFAGLEPAHLDRLQRCASEAYFGKDDYLLRQNREMAACHLLSSGRVLLESCDTRGACVAVQTLEAGAVLGWSWLLPPYHSYFDARALGDVTTVALDCHCLRAAMEADHDFGYEFLKRALRPLIGRLQACRLQLVDVYAHPDPAHP